MMKHSLMNTLSLLPRLWHVAAAPADTDVLTCLYNCLMRHVESNTGFANANELMKIR